MIYGIDVPAKIGLRRLSGMTCESRLNNANCHDLMTHAALSNCFPQSPQASSLNYPTSVEFCHELHFYFSAISQIKESRLRFLFFAS